MAILYRLVTGKIKRKVAANPDGTFRKERFTAPHDFVPSPGELKMNVRRLTKIGEVSDDGPEVKLALLNTNLLDFPEGAALAAITKTDKKKVAAKPKETSICKLSTEEALAAIELTENTDKLNEYLAQESENKPRVRKVLIKAIDEKIALIAAEENSQDTKTSTALLA